MLGYLALGTIGVTACAVLFKVFVPAMSFGIWITDLMTKGLFRGFF